jgi:hypothetical protein
MMQNDWTVLPWPFSELANPIPLYPLDTPVFLEHLLEDAVGLAGVLAAAMNYDECDQADLIFVTRHLAEHLHATLALWREWQGGQEEGEESEDEE